MEYRKKRINLKGLRRTANSTLSSKTGARLHSNPGFSELLKQRRVIE